ncbi:hypothetical protein HPB50_020818 [Hyalomma asiaticum]|uniref:Uncharacterized protein n=1 Tax=Hyalomma asiaticum TaxID=266040 RepID=A0ACB7SA20_HYAAI|nr:hypothetical protein HPB50_020818 [Hyalomma asiaticum]
MACVYCIIARPPVLCTDGLLVPDIARTASLVRKASYRDYRLHQRRYHCRLLQEILVSRKCQSIAEIIANSVASEAGDCNNDDEHEPQHFGEMVVELPDPSFGDAVAALDLLRRLLDACLDWGPWGGVARPIGGAAGGGFRQVPLAQRTRWRYCTELQELRDRLGEPRTSDEDDLCSDYRTVFAPHL